MYAGASKGGMYKNAAEPNLGSVAFRPAIFTSAPHFHLDPRGLIVTVCQNPSVGSEAQSRMVYLLPVLKFFGPGKFSAQLVFDQPSATNDSNDAWAVGLNFKSGTQNDGGTDDQRFGPTCQFSSGGAVKLGQVQHPNPPAPGTYGGYEATTCTLTAKFNIDASANVSGLATERASSVGLDIILQLPAERLSFRRWVRGCSSHTTTRNRSAHCLCSPFPRSLAIRSSSSYWARFVGGAACGSVEGPT
jgi:hypothetical protein